jgi:lysophospholipase L1-like esterase
VSTWAAAPQATEPDNLPPPPFVRDGVALRDATLRQTVRVSVGGPRIRLRFSNAFGGCALALSAATVAPPAGGAAGVSAIRPGGARAVSFGGRTAVVVPPGAQVVSDPLDLPVAAGANLAVTVYLADGQPVDGLTSHPGSRTTSHLATGNRVADAELADATPTDHWYLVSGLEVVAGGPAVAALGDSLTDGRGSTTNGNDRWPDRLFGRLQADPRTAGVAVVNAGMGGNRVLDDGQGPGALARLDRDVLAQTGVAWLIVFEGINDLGTAAASGPAQRRTADDLIAAYDQIVTRAHAHGIAVYGATLTPFGGNDGYDDPAGEREAARQAVNRWIRAGGRFDAVLDLDRAVGDPADPRRLRAEFDEGDHLHLNPAGYRAIADSVPLRLFTDRPGDGASDPG